mmetsp:Transcript_19462/g.64459  ORF Transcript_19462/g.64459 Transcript_19462/m.64459 type:complete len:232 (-) Transcript_19462:486-1181(-)
MQQVLTVMGHSVRSKSRLTKGDYGTILRCFSTSPIVLFNSSNLPSIFSNLPSIFSNLLSTVFFRSCMTPKIFLYGVYIKKNGILAGSTIGSRSYLVSEAREKNSLIHKLTISNSSLLPFINKPIAAIFVSAPIMSSFNTLYSRLTWNSFSKTFPGFSVISKHMYSPFLISKCSYETPGCPNIFTSAAGWSITSLKMVSRSVSSSKLTHRSAWNSVTFFKSGVLGSNRLIVK